MKDITPYLKYYIGRPCLVCYDGRELPGKLHYSHMLSMDCGTLEAKHIKPIVRRLSSITEEELIELAKAISNFNLDNWQFETYVEEKYGRVSFGIYCIDGGVMRDKFEYSSLGPDGFHKLIELGFWLFGDEAFEEGYVIDTVTLKNISEKS